MYKYNKAYNGVAPIGHILKNKYPSKYFRIHHFKDKQYPIDKKDNIHIIELYESFFNTIVSRNTLVGYLSTYDLNLNELNNKWINDLNLIYYGEYDIHEEEEKPYYVSVYKFIFEQSSFEKMIIDIANEEFDGSVIFFDINSNNIIAPYPGGADIFIQNKKINNFKLKGY